MTAEPIVCHRIVIKPDTISEVDGLPLVTIPRDEIVSIQLTHGLVAERPLLFMIVGVAIALVGVAGARLIVDYFVHARGGFPRTGAGAALGLVLGPWLVASTLRRGPLLEVRTTRGIRKLQFGGAVDGSQLREFVELARETGLTIST